MSQSQQFKNGKAVEAWLDRFFRQRGFEIEPTSAHQERVLHLGDRIFKKEGQQWHVEYKSGLQTFYTGNVFLETISVDKPDNFRDGWLLTCQADFIVYATIYNKVLLIFKPEELRGMLAYLRLTFPEAATGHRQNKDYNTHGLLVPFEYACNELAVKVINLDDQKGETHDPLPHPP